MSDVEVSPDGRSSTIHYGAVSNPELEQQIDRALSLMEGDAHKAANLVAMWIQQGHVDGSFVADLVMDHISRRVKARAKRNKE